MSNGQETCARYVEQSGLVDMINQIAVNFEAIGHDHAATATADHVLSFWNPRMRTLISNHLDGGGEGLSPIAFRSVEILRQPGTTGHQTRATEFNAIYEVGHADAG